MIRYLCFLPLFIFLLVQTLSAAFMPSVYATVFTAVVCTLVFFPLWQRTNKKTILLHPGALVLSAIAGAAFSYACYMLMLRTGMYARFPNDTQEALFSLPLLLQFTGLCLFVPLCEELLYRGFLLYGLQGFLPKTLAAALEIILFSVLHGNLIQALYALPAAVILTFLCEKYGLASAISFHIGANLCTVLARLLRLLPVV